MSFLKPALLMMACLLAVGASNLQAHFAWLEVEKRGSEKPVLQCYFGEGPTPDDPELLSYVSEAKFWQVPLRGKPVLVELKHADGELKKELATEEQDLLHAVQRDWGVMERGKIPFLIRYYGKTGPSLTNGRVWQNKNTQELLELDVVPALEEGKLVVTASFRGKPAAGADVTFLHQLSELDEKLIADENGQVRFDLSTKPIHAVRVRLVEEVAGEHDGKKYGQIRHYTTVTFPEASFKGLQVATPYPEIPELVTSLGGAISGQHLYIYGGHTGGAHSYSDETQANTLWSLDLNQGKEWKSLGQGPRMQGLALVSHEGKLYRIGGFTAKNKEGEDHDLWSQNSFASYDVKTGEWQDLPTLPEPRSSFDAVVLDHKIYVVGGWTLQGESKSEWRTSALVYDLKAEQPAWKEIAAPDFKRRALAVAVHQGKIYALGGMGPTGPTTETAVYDPQNNSWTNGPSLVGSGMTGFGGSAFAIENDLFVSTFDGTLQKLSADGQRWDVVGNLPNARFFHRMLPVGEGKLLFVGGASMESGKFETVDVLDVNVLNVSE